MQHALLRHILLIVLLAARVLAAANPSTPTTPSRFSADELAQGYSFTTILAQPKAGTAETFDSSLETRLGLHLKKSFAMVGGMRVLEVPTTANLTEVMAQLQASGLYEVVSLDNIHSSKVTPTDSEFSRQWSLRNTGGGGGKNGADISATTAWDTRSSAASVIVAVIDTGLYLEHPDISGNLWTNSAETAGDGVDNDKDGYIDDVHGINAIASGTSSAGNPSDDEGHGTHVAGIIGAMGNNGTGIAGVAWQVKLMPLKFMDTTGKGSSSDEIECLNYAILKGAQIINASFGVTTSTGTSTYNAAEFAALQAAQKQGIIIVCAAGNDGADTDLKPFYPSNYGLDNLLTVSNSTNLDDASSSSNHGSGSSDLFAPGTDILSLGYSGATSAYVLMSGTSMAAPHVTGALALLRAQFPSDTYRQLINRLLRSVDVLPSYAGKCQTAGRLNLAKALASTDNRPFNDDFSTRAQLAGSNVSVRSCMTGSTRETSDPTLSSVTPQGTLWFEWTAIADGSVILDTAGSAFDTLLGVYTGATPSSLTLVAANDNVSSSLTTSSVSFVGAAGVSYKIVVGSKSATSGLLLLNLTTVPAHDKFATPKLLEGPSPLSSDYNALASRESGEPAIDGVTADKSLWYTWTAPATRHYQLTFTSSDFTPLLAVYNPGTKLGALTQISSFSQTSGDPTCGFDAVQGQTYLFMVASRSGGSSGSFTLSLIDAAWQLYAAASITNAPAVGPGGIVYIADGATLGTDSVYRGKLYALNPDGSTRWTYVTSYGMDSSCLAVAADGTVIFPDSAGNVTALHPDGTLKWTVQPGGTTGTINNAPALAANGAVTIKDNNGVLYSLSGDTGATLWSYKTGASSSYSAPSIGPDGSVYVGDGGYSYTDTSGQAQTLYSLHAVTGSTGVQRWRFTADGAIYSTPAIASDGGVIFATTNGGVYKVTAAGEQVWYVNINAGVGSAAWSITSSPAIGTDGTVYFAGYDGVLHALDGATGATHWVFNLGNEVRASSPAIASDGTIYVGSYDKRIWAVKADGSTGRPYSTGDWIRSSPVISGSRLYFGSNDRRFYAVDLDSSGSAASAWPQRAADAARSGRSRSTAPVITAQPVALAAVLGHTVQFSVNATGTGLSYQWFKDGLPIAGATSSTLVFSPVFSTDPGSFTVVVSSQGTATSSDVVKLQVSQGSPGRIINLSARGVIPVTGNTFTIGFVVSYGSENKPLLIRGLGPTLQSLVANHALKNPALSVFNDSSVSIGSNNDWISTPELILATSNFTGLPLISGSADAALLISLKGLNTCQISDQGGDTGVTIAELYDADAASGATPSTGRLMNVSARNYVGTGSDILVAGFVINGEAPKTILLRGIGPALSAFKVQGFLSDPELKLYRGSTLIQSNDNWGGSTALSAAFTSTQAFSLPGNSLDAAILITLDPGSYTVELRGVGNTTGNGMIEVYEVP